MGNSISTTDFERESILLDNEIKRIIDDDGESVITRDKMSLNEICEKYTFVIEKRLNKHIKVHLQNLNSAIYMIPKERGLVEIDDITVKKTDLCSQISSHYTRIFKILHMIRIIYDLENKGNNSIAGLVNKNISIIDGVVQLTYCESIQLEESNGKLNMDKLAGLSEFVNSILTKEESKVFIKHFQELFLTEHYDMKKIGNHICKNTLLKKKEFQNIYNISQVKCGGNSNGYITPRNHDLRFDIKSKNLIFDLKFCLNPKVFVIKEHKEIKKLIQTFYKGYLSNLKNIKNTVKEITVFNKETNTLVLKTLTSYNIDYIEHKFKKNVMIFFLESIVNYKKILKYAMENPNLNVSRKSI